MPRTSVVQENKDVEHGVKPAARSDEELVRDCLNSKPEAWNELLDKYKNLIFSVPIKYGFSRDDAADVFQDVCLGLLSDLHTLREPRALAKWLIIITARKCFQRRRQSSRVTTVEPQSFDLLEGEIQPETAQLIDQAQSEQALREGVQTLPARCQKLVKMLFFETPTRPYQSVAKDLGIAVGSIGFIRQRCLAKLRKTIEKLGMGRTTPTSSQEAVPVPNNDEFPQ